MGNISFQAGYVFALYDVCTEYPINSAKYNITTDSGSGILSKGRGIFVLTGNLQGEFTVNVEVEGYQPYRHFVGITKKDMKKEVFWLIPIAAPGQPCITMTSEPNVCYQIFIKNRESIVRLAKEYNKNDTEINLQEKNNKISDGRWILIEDMKDGASEVRKITETVQNVSLLDEPVDRDFAVDSTRIYKGFSAMVDEYGNICLPLSFDVKDSEQVKIYKDNKQQHIAFEVI
jgi:hypothetical protein